ncbi:mitochondrial ATPase expression-domain-containing protein [Tricladium varicosporioides]|nr:mitochondrial ATPase expression-domain-containing protein [Hymenoscyphus varicosporioides]
MSTLLSTFGAIESRIPIFSCPHGISGRLHYLRLRRCFHNHARRFATDLHSSSPHNNSAYDHVDPNVSLVRDVSTAIHQRKSGIDVGKISQQSPRWCAEDLDYTNEIYREYGRNKYSHRRKERRHRNISHLDLIKPPGFDWSLRMDELEPVEEGDSVTGLDLPQARNLLNDALRIGDPQGVLDTLLRIYGAWYSKGESKLFNELLHNLSPNSFSELLRCLDPTLLVGSTMEIHRDISPAYATILGLPNPQGGPYHGACTIFLFKVRSILFQRHQVSPLCQSDLKYLLKCARVTGKQEVAHEIWQTLCQSGQGVRPDVECYNHLLAVKCWAVKAHTRNRAKMRVRENLHNKQHGWTTKRIASGGVKSEVSDIFREMIRDGLVGDEETFCHMMVAFARDGDMDGVASIIQRIWGVDVDVLISNQPEQRPKSYKSDSPFYPSDRLLYTIAHSYGINNAIPTALKLIDYFSRHYSVSINFGTWEELLQWTYVLTREKQVVHVPETEHEDSPIVPRLPAEAVSHIWRTMTSNPYNVEPTIEMYDKLIMNLIFRQRYGEAQIRMQEGHALYEKIVAEMTIYIEHIKSAHLAGDKSPFLTSRGRELELLQLSVRRKRQYVRKWVRKLIRHGSRMNADLRWVGEGLPTILREWASFLPNRMKTQLHTGHLKVWTGAVNENRYRAWNASIMLPKGRVGRAVLRARRLETLESPATSLPEDHQTEINVDRESDSTSDAVIWGSAALGNLKKLLGLAGDPRK